MKTRLFLGSKRFLGRLLLVSLLSLYFGLVVGDRGSVLSDFGPILRYLAIVVRDLVLMLV